MGLIVTLAGQDITDFVDEPTIQVVSVLGQGAGAGSEGAGQATTCEFIADLGPIPSALGAGQTRPSTYKEVVKTDAPNAYYRLDSDTTCLDSSGHAQEGLVQNGPLKLLSGATGDLNPAWETDGVAHIRLPLVLTSTDNVTLEAAVKLVTATTFGPLIQMGDDGTGYGLGIGNGTDWTADGDQLMLRVGSTYYAPGTAIHIPADDQYHTVSVKLSGGTATFFVDSVSKGTATGYTVSAPTGHGYLGSTSGGLLAEGIALDEVALYATALADGRFGAHFGALGVGPVLVRQGEVTITDATGTLIFGGYATLFTDESLPTLIKTKIDCHDYMQDLDRVEVNEVYIGEDDVFIIKDILTKYAPWISQSALPATGTYTFDKRYVRAKSVKEALQKLAVVTGYMVWITPDKVIHYAAPTDASTAPFSLSDDPNFTTTFGYDFQSEGYTTDDTAIINRVYFYGGKNISPDFSQDLRVQANGANKVFQLAYYPHGISTDGKVHVIKNGTDLVVGSPFDTTSLGKLISDGGTADVLLNADAETLTFDTAPATGLTQLDAEYRYNTPLVVVVSDKASNQFYGHWYDGKLDDSSVLDATTAIQRSRVLLAQQNFGLTTVKLTTWQGGLQAGMLVTITNALRGLTAVSYLVQKVTANPLGAGNFSYDVELGAWNYTATDVLFAAARRAGVQDTTTEEDTSVVQAQETVEGSDVAIVINLSTRTSGGYYSRTSAVGDGHDAYSGFFTITS